MSSFGMMGALSGLGQGLQEQSKFLAREEEANKDMARKQSFEQWLMAARETYTVAAEDRSEARTIRGEGRATAADIAKDERSWKNEQDRAPTKAKIAADADVTKKKADLGFDSENIDTITANKKKMAEAGKTDEERDLTRAHASYYKNAGEAMQTKADSAANGGGNKIESEELKAVRTERQRLAGEIEKAKLAQTWDDKNPHHIDLQNKLIGLTVKERQMAAQFNRPGADADPQGLRAKPAGMMGPTPTTRRGEPGTGVGAAEPDGRQILMTEFGGDKAKVQADIDGINEAFKNKNINGDQKGALQGRLRQLQAALQADPQSVPLDSGAAPDVSKRAPVGAAVPPTNAVAKPAPARAKPAEVALDAQTDERVRALRESLGIDKRFKGDAAADAQARFAQPTSAAAPAEDPLLKALGASGTDPASQIVAQRAPALRAAADEIKAAQQQVVAAAKSQDGQAVAQATQRVSMLSARIDKMLAEMNPQQVSAVKRALGVV